MHGRRETIGAPKSYAHVCEAFSLTYTIRMHLHFYVTYAIIALRHLAESQQRCATPGKARSDTRDENKTLDLLHRRTGRTYRQTNRRQQTQIDGMYRGRIHLNIPFKALIL